jgi:hypothetical protein
MIFRHPFISESTKMEFTAGQNLTIYLGADDELCNVSIEILHCTCVEESESKKALKLLAYTHNDKEMYAWVPCAALRPHPVEGCYRLASWLQEDWVMRWIENCAVVKRMSDTITELGELI